jgi:hypothetical protein
MFLISNLGWQSAWNYRQLPVREHLVFFAMVFGNAKSVKQ